MAASAVGALGVALAIAWGRGGGALLVGSGGLVFGGAVGAAVSWRRARRVAALLSGHGFLARWLYPKDVSEPYLEALFVVDLAAARRTARVAAVLCGAGCLLIAAVRPWAWGECLFVFLGLGGLLVGGAEWGPRFVRARRRASPQEAIVASGAAYVAGALYTWDRAEGCVRDAGIVLGARPALRIDAVQSTFVGSREVSVVIPVSPGAERAASEAARAVLAR